MAGCLLKESLTRSRGSHEDHKAERRPGNGEFVETSVPVGAWFGGKRKVAAEVWRRFGDVPNYVEPFFGSGAVLLGRPTSPSREVINDLDGFVVNFWRAVKGDPKTVEEYADWLQSEADLRARHNLLRRKRKFVTEKLQADPDYFDAKLAGFWCYGACLSLGDVWQRKTKQTLAIAKAGGLEPGVIPFLSERIKITTVLCGDWSRALSDTRLSQLSAVFLDPPYAGEEYVYSSAASPASTQAREWAIANGDNPLLRIALCGYEGEHDMPASWSVHAWKAVGGYGNQSETNENARRERIWFSPHCIRPEVDHPLFADDDDDPETEDQL